MPKLFSAELWSPGAMRGAHYQFTQIKSQGVKPFNLFLDGLLLHEQIVLPTQDFISLAVMVKTFGQRAVLDMLEQGCLKFIRLKGTFGYAGNGVGVSSLTVTGAPDGKIPSLNAELQDSITPAYEALGGMPLDSRIIKLILETTTEIDASSINDELRKEVEEDALKSSYLRDYFGIEQDINNLPGLDANQIRVIASDDEDSNKDQISQVLALAMANLELILANKAGCLDASTLSPTGHLLKGKTEKHHESSDAFTTLCEIADVPDVRPAVLNGEIKIQKLLKLRKSKDGEQFRHWFHENCRFDPVSTGREYAALLREVSWTQTLPMRIIRFLTVTAMGQFIDPSNPYIGISAGMADSFAVDTIFRNASAKYFIENMRQFQGQKRPQVTS